MHPRGGGPGRPLFLHLSLPSLAPDAARSLLLCSESRRATSERQHVRRGDGWEEGDAWRQGNLNHHAKSLRAAQGVAAVLPCLPRCWYLSLAPCVAGALVLERSARRPTVLSKVRGITAAAGPGAD